MKKSTYTMISALWLAAGTSTGALAVEPDPVVLELFTSQGCSSCPAADTLLQELAKEPGIIALSFHVHYWDGLGWRDPFSSKENTRRQSQYAENLHQNSVFTPQLIVAGMYSAAGNDNEDARKAIDSAREKPPRSVPITLTADDTGHLLKIHVGTTGIVTAPSSVIAVRYRRNASTEIPTGENAGRTLTSINNVTELKKLGAWQHDKESEYEILIGQNTDEGIAVLLQNDGQGRIISAQTYPK